MFIRLTSIVSISNQSVSNTKCITLNKQKCMIQPTLINLHPNKCSQELHYYPFAANLDRSVRSCDSLNDLSNKACVSNKTKNSNA